MPYQNPVVAFVDQLGYIYCPACSTDRASDIPMDSGNSALLGESCDSCGADIGACYDPSNRVRIA